VDRAIESALRAAELAVAAAVESLATLRAVAVAVQEEEASAHCPHCGGDDLKTIASNGGEVVICVECNREIAGGE
jgi:ribosomal protein L37AE/L43A